MTTRPVRTNDPPAAALPESSRYLEALTYRASREAKALRLRRWWMALVVLSLAWGLLLTWDNLRMAGLLAEAAKHRQVFRLEESATGHQRLVLLDDTLTPSKGARANAAAWFVRWTRQVGSDPVTMARDRAAARARLVGGAARKWDALVAADLDPAAGWTRDVTGLAVEERELDPETGLTSFHLVWTEATYRDFKPVGRALMAAAVVTLDGEPRDGALDGVNVSGFSEPAATPLATPGTVPRLPGPAPQGDTP